MTGLLTTARLAILPQSGPTTQGREDTDPSRMATFTDGVNETQKQFLGPMYGNSEIRLSLVKNPDCLCRSAGSALACWGIDVGKWKDLAVTLLASPMGKSLYLKLEFQKISVVKVLDGEDEIIKIRAIAYASMRGRGVV